MKLDIDYVINKIKYEQDKYRNVIDWEDKQKCEKGDFVFYRKKIWKCKKENTPNKKTTPKIYPKGKHNQWWDLVKKTYRKKSNVLMSQLFLLSIVDKNGGGISRRDLIQKYCEQYEDRNFPTDLKDLNYEVKNNRYRDWLDELVGAGLLKENKEKREKGNANGGPPSEFYELDRKTKINVEYIINEDNDIATGQAIKTLKIWMAICNEFCFFPIKLQIETLFQQLFSDFNKYSSIKWIQTTSPSLNIKSHKQDEEEYIEDKLWKIAEAITEPCKISFEKDNKEINNFIPCILREHRGKWYILGFFPGSKQEKIYPYNLYNLSKVEQEADLDEKEIKLKEEKQNLIEDLFIDSLGISTSWHNSDEKDPTQDTESKYHTEPLKISFKVKDGKKFDNIKYLKMDPIHSTQVVSKFDESGYSTISLTCFPDSDLVREIRKIGLHNIKDIKCTWKDDSIEPLPDLDKWVKEM